MCLIDAVKSTGINFETYLTEEDTVFSSHLIQSLTIKNDNNDEWARVGDVEPDLDRGNAIAWAVTEALLRMMYDADNSATMIDRININCGYWAKILGRVPRMSAYRDASVVQAVAQWMKRFASVNIEEWTVQKCMSVYSATSALLVLYTPMNMALWGGLFVGTLAYGGIVYLGILGYEKLKDSFRSK
jgi:hypothetical protein